MNPVTLRAPAMTLVNMVTGDARTAQFNPTELEEALGATYAKHQVPGLSHQRKHFINTDDVTFNFELFYHAMSGKASDLQAILDDRKFLYALAHPRRAGGISKGGAPRALFIWPTFISLTCVITKLTFKYTHFNSAGSPTRWSARVTLEEIRDEFVGMDDILAQGTQRAPGADDDEVD